MDFLLSVAFLVGVSIMYWSMPAACLLYKIRFLTFSGARDDMFQWAKFVIYLFGIKLHKVGSNDLFRTTDPVLYIANHRCWADFFLDVYVTEGRAALLSRWAVYPVFPIFLTAAMFLRGVIFFNRNKVFDKNVFNTFLDTCISSSPLSGLMIYPEGHRSTLSTSLPLRRGMLHYAQSRKMPLQIVITKDKEKVLAEKRLAAGFGAHLMVGYSEVIKASEYEDFEQFMAKVQAAWDATWKSVYAADASSPILQLQEAPSSLYPLRMKVLMAVYSFVATAMLLALLLLSFRLILLTQFGMLVALGMLAVVAAAIQRATLPTPVWPHSLEAN